MLSDPKKVVLRWLTGFALMMIATYGGGTKAAGQSTQALTVGGGSGDALDPRNPPFNAIPNDGEDDREKL